MTKNDERLDLLLGLMALRLGLISENQLFGALKKCADDQAFSLTRVLANDGILPDAQIKLLQTSVEEHLKQNSDDPEASLREIQTTLFAGNTSPSTIHEFLTSFGRKMVPETIRSDVDIDMHATREQQLPAEGDIRFRVLRPHAKGGLGQVSVAMDKEINREVALKELQLRFASNKDIRGRFLLEAEITGALEHPGVAPVYGRGQYQDGRPYYAMRFIRGETLQDAINDFHRQDRKVFDVEDVRFRKVIQRFIDVCNTIHYAHSRGVVHRDIKPANIILGNFGETIVVDWGLAKQIGDQEESTQEPPIELASSMESSGIAPTTMGSVVGTPGYMSPEQALGRHDQVRNLSDVYSLGATLYHLLTGHSAFPDHSADVLDRIGRGDFPGPRELNRDIPAPLDAICLKAMRQDPTQRYDSVFQLSEELQRWLAGQAIQARRESVPERFRRWRKKNRTLVTSVFAATAVTLVATTISLLLLQSAYRSEQASFLQTRKTVDEYFTLVSEQSLLDQPGFQPLRKKLLEQARSHYTRFVSERQNNKQLKSELGLARYRLGLIVETIDSPEEAIPEFRAAIAIQQRLQNESPGNRQHLGNSFNALGRSLYKSSRLDDSLDAFESARQIRKVLADAAPDNVEFQRQLANTLMNLGTLYRARQETDKALGFYTEAQEVRNSGIRNSKDADLFKLRRDLAKGNYNLANLVAGQQNVEAAKQYYESAVNDFESLLSRRAGDLGLQNLLSISCRRLGDMQVASEPQKAQALYEKALNIIQPLARLNSDVPAYQTAHAAILNSLAFVRQNARDPEQATRYYEMAVQVLQLQLESGTLNTAGLHDYMATHLNLSMLYLNPAPHEETSHTPQAERLLQDVDELYKTEKDKLAPETIRLVASCMIESGRVHFCNGRWTNAAKSFQQALSILEQLAQETDDPRVPTSQLTWAAEVNSIYELENVIPESDRQEFQRSFDHDLESRVLKLLGGSHSETELQLDVARRITAMSNLMRINRRYDLANSAGKHAAGLLSEIALEYGSDPLVRKLQVENAIICANTLTDFAIHTPENKTAFVAEAQARLDSARKFNPNNESILPTQEKIDSLKTNY